MWERCLNYCTFIRKHVTYVFGVFIVSRALVIRSSGSWPSLSPLRSFLTLRRPYWLLFCFVSRSSYEPFAQPISSTLNSSPPLDLSTLLLVETYKRRWLVGYQLDLPLVFTSGGTEWLSPLAVPPEHTASLGHQAVLLMPGKNLHDLSISISFPFKFLGKTVATPASSASSPLPQIIRVWGTLSHAFRFSYFVLKFSKMISIFAQVYI